MLIQKTGPHIAFISEGKKLMRKMYAIDTGSMIGGAIRLNKIGTGNAIVIGEGIETSLSAGILTGLPAWSSMDAGKLEKVEIPEQITQVVIAGDNDVSYTGQSAAYNLAKRLKNHGKIVNVIFPEKIGTDFNDLACINLNYSV